MNELRWIILGFGVLVIFFIYLWETIKRNRNRGKSNTGPARLSGEAFQNLHISPRKEKNIDITSAVAAFNAYLRETGSGKKAASGENRGDEIESEIDTLIDSAYEQDKANPSNESQGNIIIIYIVAPEGIEFNGPELMHVLGKSGMQYGDMQIFHYQWHNSPQSNRPLFSIANIREPGTFDVHDMQNFRTRGLAMFMNLPADIGGDIAFEIMLDNAQEIARQLQARLVGADHNELTADAIDQLREIAHRY